MKNDGASVPDRGSRERSPAVSAVPASIPSRDLLPCPFCGKPAKVESVRGSQSWLAHCIDRLCGSVLASGEEAARRKWNVRRIT